MHTTTFQVFWHMLPLQTHNHNIDFSHTHKQNIDYSVVDRGRINKGHIFVLGLTKEFGQQCVNFS